VAEVTGCDPGDIELEAGDANVLGRGNSYEVVAVPKGAGDGGAGFEARLEACLPEGWSLASQSNAPTRLTNNLPEGALVARRSFLAGGVERPEGGGEMAQCVEDMACYVACEAACLGLLGPALEVSIYGAAGQSPGPETGRQDTVTMQEAEIARLEVLLAGGEEACGRLEGEGERFEAELSRARASLDALQRERDIMSRPWPLRKAGMWLEARRRAKLGL
jgi:hypothetical protein